MDNHEMMKAVAEFSPLTCAMQLIGKLEGEAPMMHMRRTVELVQGDDDKAVFLAAVGKDPLLLVRRACDFQAGRALEPL